MDDATTSAQESDGGQQLGIGTSDDRFPVFHLRKQVFELLELAGGFPFSQGLSQSFDDGQRSGDTNALPIEEALYALQKFTQSDLFTRARADVTSVLSSSSDRTALARRPKWWAYPGQLGSRPESSGSKLPSDVRVIRASRPPG